MKCKHQLIIAQCLCSACPVSIIPLHVLPGCDHNTDLYGARRNSLPFSQRSLKLTAPSGTKRSSVMERFVIRNIYCEARPWKNGGGGGGGAAKWRALKKKKKLSNLCLTWRVPVRTWIVLTWTVLTWSMQTPSHIFKSITSSKVTPHRSPMDGISQMAYVCLSVLPSSHFPHPYPYLHTTVMIAVKVRTNWDSCSSCSESYSDREDWYTCAISIRE